MKIGELFLDLGIKGSEKTVAAITGVRKGMSEITSTSIEAKAAILGAMYGLERLVQMSNQMGASLTNFNALTGLSAKQLQQWQYAARQVGVSGQEIEGSIKGVQNAMSNMLLGKGAPEGMGLLSAKVGFDPAKARDTLYVMQQLQKFAQSVPADIGNQVLKSFGLSEGTIAAMRRNAFRPDVFKRAPTYSDKELSVLDRANAAWSNLATKIEMAIGHFNALHGGKLVADISMITDKVVKMVESFSKLADQLKVFDLIGKIFEGWGYIFDGINSVIGNIGHSKDLGVIQNEGWLPNKPPSTEKNSQININQNLNFQHDGKDSQKNSESHKKAIEGAFRQFTAQGQGS